MNTRREFLTAISVPIAAAVAAPRIAFNPLARLDDWSDVQHAFAVDRSIINLNNGAVSPAPAVVQRAMADELAFSNQCPPKNLWEIQEPRREAIRGRLAEQWGVSPEELAFTRNTTEGLHICQFGIDLQHGDEVLTTTQDYPRMRWAFDQRARRDGIIVNTIKLPVPCLNDDEIVARFENAITPRTRVILLCHVINLTGQILPVRRIVDIARANGIATIVDGAHSFAHIEFKISDLDCDYYATSLHKWLFAPHGTGLLYVRQSNIKSLWPLNAAPPHLEDNIRKFEEIGTHPAANTLAIDDALTFNQSIGFARKQARLRQLRDMWVIPLQHNDRVHLNTNLDASCAIANMRIDDIDTRALNTWLWDRHKILTAAITHPEFHGIRVSPSLYTTEDELARFVDAVNDAMSSGLT